MKIAIRCREPSQGGENSPCPGEDARGERAEALYQSLHAGRQRKKLAGRRGYERCSRLQAACRQKSRPDGSKVGGCRVSSRSFHGYVIIVFFTNNYIFNFV